MNKKKNIQDLSTWEFIEHITENIDKKILSFSQDSIDKLLVEIHTFAQDKVFDELYIIGRVLDHVNRKKAYYNKQVYNGDALKYIAGWLCAVIILGLILYFILIYYHFPKEKELNDFIKCLERFGITITKCSKPAYRRTHYYLEVSAVRKYLWQDDYWMIKQLLERMHKVHGALYGWIRSSIIIVSGSMLMAVNILFSCIRSWLRPYYKERLEALFSIEKRLRQAEDSLFEEKYFKGKLKK